MVVPAAEDTPQVVLGRLIRAARWTLGWKQDDLARELGVAVTTISAIERGDRKRYSRDELLRYEEVLGITDSRLLTVMGFLPQPESAATPARTRKALSYGGVPLTEEQEQSVIDYIYWIRSRDQAG